MRRFAGMAALGLAVLLSGCGNRGGSLVGYGPEGVPNQAILQAQVDTTADAFTAHVIVFAPAPTNRVRLYDDVNDGGYRPTGDFQVEPTRSFESGWSLYEIALPNFDVTASHVLLARCSRDGQENLLSPLTNGATIPPGTAATLVAGRDTLPVSPRAPVPSPDASPLIKVDSLYFKIGAVANAQRIVVEVTQRKVDQYLAVFDRQGPNTFARTYILQNVNPALNQTYLWHVDEYDAQARLIAATTVSGSFIISAPRDPSAPYEWPSDLSHWTFLPWTLPAFMAGGPPAR